ncbi:MAG: hypothetical protein HS132_13515 [Planctomycetia bacterium]|nr:hypothetical protein [Planctomycetia bacterium]
MSSVKRTAYSLPREQLKLLPIKKEASRGSHETPHEGEFSKLVLVKTGIDNRMLARSAVWRWPGFFGSLKNTLRNAFDLIRQAAPNSPVFRHISPPYPGKYKSKQRKTFLERALQLFNAGEEYHLIFGCSFFPDLGADTPVSSPLKPKHNYLDLITQKHQSIPCTTTSPGFQ